MKRFSADEVDQITARSRALGDGTRVRLLTMLSRGEQSVGELADAAGIQQSTASKHLQVLFHAGVVQRRRAASAVMYRLVSSELLEWCRFLATRTLSNSRGNV